MKGEVERGRGEGRRGGGEGDASRAAAASHRDGN